MAEVRRIHTDRAPDAVGPYSQAIVHSGLVYTAGQIPLDPRSMQMVEGDVAAQTERVMQNLAAVLEAAGPRPAVMIGDRHHDLDATTAIGIPGVGVTWAGDHADELREAGAVAVLGDPAELPAALRAAIAV
jgi:enamine deaminase RidA (YjgF/YER057c/UK114 family)